VFPRFGWWNYGQICFHVGSMPREGISHNVQTPPAAFSLLLEW
jgi:hypothetical protein